MFRAWIEHFKEQGGDPQQLFYYGQFLLAGVFLVLFWIFRPKPPESRFRPHSEPFKKPTAKKLSHSDPFAEARLRKEPLQLGGIRIDGRPHEILGISATATLPEVQKAYRDLMKHYHPDRVGSPGSREWQDAQKIAEAINRAKEEMVKARR